MVKRYKVKKSRTTGSWCVLDAHYGSLAETFRTWKAAVRHAIYLNTNGGSTP